MMFVDGLSGHFPYEYRRVSRGGGGGVQGAWGPPLEIEEPKKKKVIRAILSYLTYILLLF